MSVALAAIVTPALKDVSPSSGARGAHFSRLAAAVKSVHVGREERIIDLGSALADWLGVEPVIAALGSDYGGARVYNPLLYAADQEVAIHRDRFQNLYLPILQDAWGVYLEPNLSYARFT